MLSMPATAPDVGVHKLVNVVAGNRDRGLPTITGVVSVYDGRTARLRLLLDGPTITTRRTAAVSMLGLRHLLPQGPRHASIFGTGVQARGHVHALCALHPDCRIDIIGRSLDKASAFVAGLNVGEQVHAVDGVASESDLVVTATSSLDPVYAQAAKAGRLVIGVGAYRDDLAEIGSQTLQGSTLYVDDLEGARHEAGDYIRAGVDWGQVKALAQLLDAGRAAGPCVYKTVGCAAWDLAAARCALVQAGAR